MKKLCIFCGARPNFIKVAPIIRVINRLSEENSSHKVSYSLVYAGSENDPTLEDQLFDNLSIRRPDVYLGVECENLNELTGQVNLSLRSIYKRIHLMWLSLWTILLLQWQLLL